MKNIKKRLKISERNFLSKKKRWFCSEEENALIGEFWKGLTSFQKYGGKKGSTKTKLEMSEKRTESWTNCGKSYICVKRQKSSLTLIIKEWRKKKDPNVFSLVSQSSLWLYVWEFVLINTGTSQKIMHICSKYSLNRKLEIN